MTFGAVFPRVMRPAFGPGLAAAAAAAASYWLAFDGNDYITLPSGAGDEPATAITIEAWIKDSPLETIFKPIVSRGNRYNTGYSLVFATLANLNAWLLGNLKRTTSYEGFFAPPYASKADTAPWHIAMSWGAATGNVCYFINGVLIARSTGITGTLAYTGDPWWIGKDGTSGWFMKGKLSMIRVSDVCRYTASFTPPTGFASDANTVGLWLATEGSGTTLVDSGPLSNDGAFKGAGEPAWSDAVDLSVLDASNGLWAACKAAVPVVTGTNVYLYRVDADTYHVFRKIHATGPYWVKWQIDRASSAQLCVNTASTGVPTPANDDPTSWSSAPATQLMGGGVSEYVLSYYPAGGSSANLWGSGHGYETLDSEGWYVDGSPVTLANGEWANGATVEYRSTQHHNDQVTAVQVCNVSKNVTWSSAVMYAEASYVFDWLVDAATNGANDFPVQMCLISSAMPTVTFSAGGTDYATTGSSILGFERSGTAAAWNAANDAIMVTDIDFADGLRYAARDGGVKINQGVNKVYFHRPFELDSALTGSQWSYSVRFMALDNCGNHFLKTT